MTDVPEPALRPTSPEDHQLAWVWLLGLAAVSFGVGWFADALMAMF